MKKIILAITFAFLVSFVDINAQVIHRTTSGNTVSAAITTKTVTKQKKEFKEYLRPLGFRQMAEVNVGVTNWGVNYIAGYKFNQYFFLGAGLGLEAIGGGSLADYLYDRNRVEYFTWNNSKPTAFNFPLYAHAKVYFTKTRVQPSLDLSFGGNFGNAKGLSGVLFDIGPGFNVYINEKLSFYTSVRTGFITRDLYHTFISYYPVESTKTTIYSGEIQPNFVQFHIGLEF